MLIKRGSLPLLVVFQVLLNLQLVCGSSTPRPAGQSLTPDKEQDGTSQARENIDRQPPGSPVNLFMPDEFQFYTLNGNGELVMKQMTKQEIQGMLAASGDDLEIGQSHHHLHQTQLPDSSDEAKVSDVVQNVQNVVQSELNKSAPILQGITSIPNSVNDQWANMLPHLLSGGLSGGLDQDGSILLPTNEDVETEVINMIPMQPAKQPSPSYGSTSSYVKLKPSGGVTNEIVSKKPVKPYPSSTTTGTTITESFVNKLTTLAPTKTAPHYKKPIVNQTSRPVTGTYIKKPLPTSSSAIRTSTTNKPVYIYDKFGSTQQTYGNRFPPQPTYHKKPSTSPSKPTYYIPLSVSSPHFDDLNNMSDRLEQKENSQQLQKTTPTLTSTLATTTANNKRPTFVPSTLSTTTTTTESDDSAEYSSVPMIQIPVLSADSRISTTTQRLGGLNYEMLPTLLPDLYNNRLTNRPTTNRYLVTDRSSTSFAPTTASTTTTESATSRITTTSESLEDSKKNEIEEKIKEDFFQRIENLSRTTEETLNMDSIKKITSQLTTETVTQQQPKEEVTTIYYPKMPIISMGITNPLEFETIYPTQVPQIQPETTEQEIASTLVPEITTLPIVEEEKITEPAPSSTSTTTTVSSTAKSPEPTQKTTFQSPFAPEDETSTVKVIPVYDDKIIIHTPDGGSAYVPTGSFQPIKVSLLSGNKKPAEEMPNLMETFNNYMKEHYEFGSGSSSSSSSLSAENADYTTYAPQLGPEYLQFKSKDGAPVSLNRESVDAINLLDEKQVTSKSPQKTAMDEAEKIIATAPPLSSTPDVVRYTMPPEPTPVPPSKMSSGLVAGYPSSSVKTTISEDSSETPAFDLLTQIPFSALPIFKKRPQLESVEEKINQVIDQLREGTTASIPTVKITTSNAFKERLSTLTTKKFEKVESVTRPNFRPVTKPLLALNNRTQDKMQLTAGRINLEEEKIKPITDMPKVKITPDQQPKAKVTTDLPKVKPTTELPKVKLTTEPTKAKFTTELSKAHKKINKLNSEKTPTTPTATTSTTTTTTTTTTTSQAPPNFVASVKASEEKDVPEKWTLIPQLENKKNEAHQIPPPESKTNSKPSMVNAYQDKNTPVVTLDHSSSAIGLDQSAKGLDKDISDFLNLCNDLSFKFWNTANVGLSPARSVTLSPFGMISTLAMIFLGARGLTSAQMNDVLRLDDVVTFNPHLVFQNITDTVTLGRGHNKIENAAFVRALFADRLKVRRIMPFYKEQAQQFYEGAVVDINFSTAGDILRRRTNLLIRKQTGGRIKDFVKSNVVPLRSPLTSLSANIFQTSCNSSDASSEGRDGEMYFALTQTVKQRKLVPIPAVVWKSGVSAGYEPSLDATAIALGDPKKPVSMIFIMPGQQGHTAPGDNLERLEHRLFRSASLTQPDNAWEKLLKVIIPRRLELQVPKFSHRSIVNVTSALRKMGFEHLFQKSADLKGINGLGVAHDLHLSDMIQMNLFGTCGDEQGSNRHLTETYPGTSSRHVRNREIMNNVESRVYDENSSGTGFNRRSYYGDWSETDDLPSDTDEEPKQSSPHASATKKDWNSDRINNLKIKLQQRRLMNPYTRQRRQADYTEKPRMKMDKPFIYVIRHNPTGLILHIGRFNPKN